MRLWVRASVANAIALLVALSLTAFLGYDKFTAALVELEREEVAAVVVNARDTIEAATGLGLQLKDFADAQAVLDRSLQFDKKLAEMLVFDSTGAVLFRSLAPDETRLVDPPDNWEALTDGLAGHQTWSTVIGGAFMVGSPLIAPSGAVLGGVVGVEHTHSRAHEFTSMGRRLTLAVLILFTIASILATALIRRVCPR